jgi:hypothetical protein
MPFWNIYIFAKGVSEFNTSKAMYWDLNTSEEEEDYSSEDVRPIYRNYHIHTSILREAYSFSASKKRILIISLHYLIFIGSK